MFKRGQFTLFVVLGIVLLLLIGLFALFQNQIFDFVGISQSISYPSDVQEVVDHVQECVDRSAYESVVNIGYTGGYYTLPSRSYIDANDSMIPYYLYDGEDISLSTEDLQNELNQYITAQVNACVHLEQFSSFTITSGTLSVASTVEEHLVSVEVSYPLTLTVGETVYTVSEPYTTEVDANLGWLHDIAQQIVTLDIANPDRIDYTNLLGYGVAHIIVAPVSNDTYVYILQDTSSFNNQQNYSFFFAEYYPNLVSDADCVLDLDCTGNTTCVEGACVEEEQ